jgi:very-short-patch-repair endonuclease
MSEAGITRRVAAGVLIRTSLGVYVLAGWPQTWEQDLWVALSRAGDSAVVSHRAAAALWGLDGVDPRLVEITASRRCGLRGPLIHHRDDLPASALTSVSGFPITALPQTLVDLAAVDRPDIVERAAECASRKNLATWPELTEWANSVRVKGRAGPSTLLDVLARRPTGAPATESDAETIFLQVSRRTGIGEPMRQLKLTIGGQVVRIDFAWPSRCLAVEIDGASTHATVEALGRDLRRQNKIVFGWLVLRFTWEDITRYPDQVVEILRDAWALLLAGPVRASGMNI